MMRHVWTENIKCVLAVALPFAGLLIWISGCASGPTAQQELLVSIYASQAQECVQLAPTKASADACLAKNKEFWCGPAGALYDAGACYAPPQTAPGPTDAGSSQ